MSSPARIVLVAGRVRPDDRVGHHDYLAGCRLLAMFLARMPGVEPVLVEGGWPADPSILDEAASIVVYDGGGGKQGFLADPSRIEAFERAARRGCGLVLLHQAAGFPMAHVEAGQRWFGGCYVPGTSRRGHWKTSHDGFPAHPVTTGVTPWRLTDGWLTRIAFTADPARLAPLVWASPDEGSPRTIENVAAWGFERPGGGRSFVYTGIDGHAAWTHEGLRRLVTNAVLWTAGAEIPARGADVAIPDAELDGLLTPRASFPQRAAKLLRKGIGRLIGEGRRW